MSDRSQFLHSLASLGSEWLSEYPAIAEVLSDFFSDKLSEEEAIEKVWDAARTHQASDSGIVSMLEKTFGLESSATALVRSSGAKSLLAEWGFEEEDLTYTPDESRPGYKMLHPLLTAAIVERLQFDGDIPELRTGPLPEGGYAAVPVSTATRNPVALGKMLEEASSVTTKALAEAQQERDRKLLSLVSSLGEKAELQSLAQREQERAVSVKGYEAGSAPEFQAVQHPSASVLTSLSREAKQALSYKALRSTQGRKSASPVIQDLIQQRAIAEGLEISPTHEVPQDLETFTLEWSVGIDGGASEQNPNFNFIDTAANALAAKTVRFIRSNPVSRVPLFQVKPVTELGDRRVGWQITLFF